MVEEDKASYCYLWCKVLTSQQPALCPAPPLRVDITVPHSPTEGSQNGGRNSANVKLYCCRRKKTFILFNLLKLQKQRMSLYCLLQLINQADAAWI